MSIATKTKPDLSKAPASPATSRVQSLDCLRAIACLIVILSHTSKIDALGGWTIGAYGVGLFCVLSGYLITSILLREEKLQGRIDPIKFLQRRCLRIVPAYFVVLLSCTLLMKTGLFLQNHQVFVSQTLSEFPYFATFTHNPGDGIGINHLWSISVEEQFYCFLPLLILVANKSVVRQVILLSLAVFMMPFAVMRPSDPHYCNAAFIALILGASLALNFSQLTRVLDRFNSTAIGACAVAFAACSILLEACPYGPLCSVSYVMLVWLAISRFETPAALKPMAYIGRISYGVYLVQTPISLITYWFLDRYGLAHCIPFAFAINATLSIIVGAISWELFEKRILSLRDRVQNTPAGLVLALITPALVTIGVVLHLLSKFASS